MVKLFRRGKQGKKNSKFFGFFYVLLRKKKLTNIIFAHTANVATRL